MMQNTNNGINNTKNTFSDITSKYVSKDSISSIPSPVSLKEETLHHVLNENIKNREIQARTDNIFNICRYFTDTCIRAINDFLIESAASGSTLLGILFINADFSENRDKVQDDCISCINYNKNSDEFGVVEIVIARKGIPTSLKEEDIYEFDNQEQQNAYASQLSRYIYDLYSSVSGYDIQFYFGNKSIEEIEEDIKYGTVSQGGFSLSWIPDEDCEYFDKILDESQLDAYMSGVPMQDIFV